MSSPSSTTLPLVLPSVSSSSESSMGSMVSLRCPSLPLAEVKGRSSMSTLVLVFLQAAMASMMGATSQCTGSSSRRLPCASCLPMPSSLWAKRFQRTTVSSSPRTTSMAWMDEMICDISPWARRSSFSTVFILRMASILVRNSCSSTVLVMYPSAPVFSPSTWFSASVIREEKSMTEVAASAGSPLMARHVSNPSASGRTTSSSTRSGRACLARRNPSSPVVAWITSYPRVERRWL